jgi:hypothetical protein
MIENEITNVILDTSFKLHTKFGPGLFESVYEEILLTNYRKMAFRLSDRKYHRSLMKILRPF